MQQMKSSGVMGEIITQINSRYELLSMMIAFKNYSYTYISKTLSLNKADFVNN